MGGAESRYKRIDKYEKELFMSKKSKKILAYLMFVAALCGTPAVSEARGGSGGQVKTEKASIAQRGNSDQKFPYYIFKNYGFEAAKWMMLGGGGFGIAKFSKVGDLNALAKYILGIKNADAKELESLKVKFEEEKQQFANEKILFEQDRANAIEVNNQLFADNSALNIKNLALNKHIKEKKEIVNTLENYNKKLSEELRGVKEYNARLVDLTDKVNKKNDALLLGLLSYKMSGEFAGSYTVDDSWYGAFALNQLNIEPYFNSKNVVAVAFVEYDKNFNMVGEAEKCDVGSGSFFDDVSKKAKELLGQDVTNEVIALKDVDLSDFGISNLARYSFVVKKNEEVERIIAAYFPVKSAVEVNNAENNENNENANENIQNNENNNENNGENVQNNENENDINIDNNNMNNEINANENNNINDGNNENNNN